MIPQETDLEIQASAGKGEKAFSAFSAFYRISLKYVIVGVFFHIFLTVFIGTSATALLVHLDLFSGFAGTHAYDTRRIYRPCSKQTAVKKRVCRFFADCKFILRSGEYVMY